MKTRKMKFLACLLNICSLTACQTPQYTTQPNYPSEAALVANSFNNGISTEIEMPYEQVFYNLKQAYQRCVAFTTADDLVYTDNRLEKEIQLGTLFARTDTGAYTQKMLVEALGQNKTRLSLFLPKEYKMAQSRFKQDVKRALGKDSDCNVGVVIPIYSQN